MNDLLQRVLQELKCSTGPNGSGEYMCRCPAHDDKRASLCVSEGAKGIVLKCQAGCSFDQVARAMGWKPSEFFYGSKSEAPRPARKARAPKVGEKPAKKPAAETRITAVYPYTDETGRLLYEVVRKEGVDADGARVKEFFQRIPDRTQASGYRYSVPAALRESAIYMAVEVAEAIRDGRPVYVVEGEKDVASLRELGLVATCNTGGAGKWKDGHAQHLAGADVIVIGDCDGPSKDPEKRGYVGEEHAWSVASSLTGVARRVRYIYLKASCPELPAKGDVTDWIRITGPEARARLELLAAGTPAFDPRGARPWLTEHEQAERIYSEIPGYTVSGGRICAVSAEGDAKPLATFVAVPTEIITMDDGVNRQQVIRINGWNADGEMLEDALVKATEFDGMSWVTREWDFRANVLPGTTTKDKLRYAISEAGRKYARRVTQYSHTGWRKIDGRWAYLYNGGAIGADDVTVDLGPGLRRYRLDGDGCEDWDRISSADGARATLGLQSCVAPSAMVPVLGVTFLAPLREFLDRTGITPGFSLYLLGAAQSGKSTLAALALSHFGIFNLHVLPASFRDTGNSILRKAFLLKDTLIAVDDFHPSSSQQERKRMNDTAQALSRSFGNGVGRGRLNSDSSPQESQPPRSMAVITGEDLPQITESGLARYYVVNIDDKIVTKNADLTAAQEAARMGLFEKCMEGYIRWLLRRADDLPDQLHKMFLEYRDKAGELLTGERLGRNVEAIAHIMIGWGMMLRYMESVGAIGGDEAAAYEEVGWSIVSDASRAQSREMRDERPSRMYLGSVAEMIASGRVHVADRIDREAERDPVPHQIGWRDERYYYLLAGITYAEVSRLCSEKGVAFPLTERMLSRQLVEDGILRNTTKTSKTRTVTIYTKEGSYQRPALWIERRYIDGPGGDQQLSMDDGTEVSADEVPDELKG